MELASHYLNEVPTYITEEMMQDMTSCSVDAETAFSLLLAAGLGLDVDRNAAHREFYHAYFPHMLHRLNIEDYASDPYYRSVRFSGAALGDCELKYQTLRPYEAFVSDDTVKTADGRSIPQIGYFDREFVYPTILEGGRIWMSVTPNEINTIAPAVRRAHGRVLTFGLGLGYFAYMAALKPEIASVTIVEQNERVIRLFNEQILPQFSCANKITVIQGDAFKFAATAYPQKQYDFIYSDIWHDVADGIPMYLKLKALEPLDPNAEYMYWIEDSMLCYLADNA